MEIIRNFRRSSLGIKTQKEWEPAWHSPKEMVPWTSHLKLPNASTLSAGLGASPSPIDDLTKVRNFFAHHSERSALNVLSVTGGRLPTDFLSETVPSGLTRFEMWADTLLLQASASTL